MTDTDRDKDAPGPVAEEQEGAAPREDEAAPEETAAADPGEPVWEEPGPPVPEETETEPAWAGVDEEADEPEEAELLSPDEAFAVGQPEDEDEPEPEPARAPEPAAPPKPASAPAAEPGAAAGIWARWRWIAAGILVLVLVVVYVVPNLSSLTGLVGGGAGGGGIGDGQAAPLANPVTARLEALESASSAASAQRVDLRSAIVASQQQMAEAVAQSDVAAQLDALKAEVDALVALRPAASLAAAEARIAELERQVRELEAAPSESGADAESDARLSREISEAAARIAALEAAIAAINAAAPATAPAAPAPAAPAPATRSAAAPAPAALAATAFTASSASALVVSAGLLRDRARTAEPFQVELEAVRAISPGDAVLANALAQLATHARAGVATEIEIGRRFDEIAGPVVAADRGGEAVDSRGWLARLWDSIGGAVTIRRTGDISGAGAEAAVARAELLLADGDLAGALAEMGHLQGAARSTAFAWLETAEARVAVDAAASRLAQRAASLAAGIGTPSR